MMYEFLNFSTCNHSVTLLLSKVLIEVIENLANFFY